MKTCPTCKRDLPTSDFYRDARRPDGLKSQCKSCHTESNIRTRDPERHRIARQESMRRWRRTKIEAARARDREASRKRITPDEKRIARRAVHSAVRSGAIVKPAACSRCGTIGRVSGHHHDYSKPLDVKWLCYLCHADEHRKAA